MALHTTTPRAERQWDTTAEVIERAAFLDPDRIAEAVTLAGELPIPQNRAVAESFRLVAGVDPAFASDPLGLAIIGNDPAHRERLCLALARAWKPRKRSGSLEERSSHGGRCSRRGR